jgi:hypothetical protein
LQVVPVTEVVASAVVNVVVTELPVVEPFAGALIVTVGATVSTVNVTEAEPVPAALVAATVTVWLPCDRPVYACGLVQAAAAAASSLQVVLVGEFVAVHATETLVELTIAPASGEVIVTTGIAATGKVVLADPTLPAWSVAATVMVWLPEARPL